MDPRHRQRIKTTQNLFALTFNRKKNLPFPHDQLTEEINNQMAKIDQLIQNFAPKFTLEKIAKIDLSILRLAIYELVINPKQPKKVIINEAVELAKELGGDKSFAFINGVLGQIVKQTKYGK